MILDDDKLREELRALDDPTHLEFPRNYDHAATRARFGQLGERLAAEFNCSCDLDLQVQDASFHGRITIPADATHNNTRIVIVVSNFGSLTVVAAENPGVERTGKHAKVVHRLDLPRISRILDQLSYVLVPEELLWTRYDGDSDLADDGYWWSRFFDYY